MASNHIRYNRKIIVPKRKLQCLWVGGQGGDVMGKRCSERQNIAKYQDIYKLNRISMDDAGEASKVFYTLCRWNIVVSSKQAGSRRRRASIQEPPHSKVKARRGRISILKWCVMITNFIIIIWWSRRRQDIVSTWEHMITPTLHE